MKKLIFAGSLLALVLGSGYALAQNPSVQQVWSVANSDGTLTIAPNVGAVVAGIANNVLLPGNPMAATQAPGNNSTRLATTAFVSTALSNAETADFASPPALGSTTPAAVTATTLIETNNFNNCAVTTVAGSAGDLYWSMPERGSGVKRIEIVLAGFTKASTTTITFPTAFLNTPSVTANGTTGITTSDITLSTTQAVIPVDTTDSGTIEIGGI